MGKNSGESRNYLAAVVLRRELPEEAYFRDLAPVRYLMEGHPLLFDRPVTFLVGENGSGKSTLLEAIAVACGFNAEGGTRNFRFSTCSTHSPADSFQAPLPPRRFFPPRGEFLQCRQLHRPAGR